MRKFENIVEDDRIKAFGFESPTFKQAVNRPLESVQSLGFHRFNGIAGQIDAERFKPCLLHVANKFAEPASYFCNPFSGSGFQ